MAPALTRTVPHCEGETDDKERVVAIIFSHLFAPARTIYEEKVTPK
jgi:hypothetical protein